MDNALPYGELSSHQKDKVTRNILLVELLLERVVQETVEHLGHTRNLCIKSCIGQPALELLHELDLEEALMVLTLTVRQLAGQRYEQAEQHER